jgi:integrase
VPSGIWINDEPKAEGLYRYNDRIIHAWLTYAGRYDVKTIDRHLSAIRYCEGILAGKLFSKLTRDDVAKVRDDLKRRANVSAPDNLSASSIKHVVSHLIAFFDWLLKQDGFKSLPQDLQGYLKLPQAVLASAAQVRQKEYPSLEEAEVLLDSMPSRSLVDQRAKAIFSLAFLGALRADTLVSLRIKHVDITRRLILQDASTVRAKAGKSIDIKWFPIAKSFEVTVIEWIETLKRLGFTGEDALFPEKKELKLRPTAHSGNFRPVPIMTTKHAVTDAFAIACHQNEVKFTPHSAKHSVGAERDLRPLTHEERKAWSENMGHENEQITERHYGKLSDERRFEVLEHVGANASIEPLKFSDEDLIAIGTMLAEFMQNKKAGN